ncbi:MAG: NAD(+) synthase, partial [Erysipelotrichaceae bacterium]|nr:NAD(+) synthase [Erysipelotrichaceae bacterium]
PCGRDGRRVRLNTALFAYNGEYVSHKPMDGKHFKVLHPDYRVFDDTRYFLSALEYAHRFGIEKEQMVQPFEWDYKGEIHKIGIEICEDMWSKDYCIDPTALLMEKGAELIVSISASPWTLTKETSRDKRIKEHVRNNGSIVPFYYVNVCGMQNNGKNILMFDGMSTVYDRKGNRTFVLRDDFTSELGLITGKPFCHTTDHKLLTCLVRSIQEFDKQILGYNPKWIIGLSGGLDSSVNAALLVMALGNKRVVGYNLATKYNSENTKSNAANLAEKLGIELRNGSITEAYQSTVNTVVSQYGYAPEQLSTLVHENIQARTRGHLLSTFAQIENGVIMNNGNKVEVALGYATLYGDSIGAISPLGDLTKVQMFDIAHQINDRYGTEIVPERLLPVVGEDSITWEMAPSAELKDNQYDPMKWFYHDWLISRLTEYPGYHTEDIMQSYLDGSIYETEMGRWIRYYHLDEPKAFIEDLEWVLRQMRIAIFKRIQMPPIVMVTRGAFGMDYREVQGTFHPSLRYQQLKEAILRKGNSYVNS